MYVSFQSTTPTAAMETCTWSCANKWGFDQSQILNDVDSVMKLAFTWGYRWRKSYSDMNSNAEVKTHSNFSNGYSPVAEKAS